MAALAILACLGPLLLLVVAVMIRFMADSLWAVPWAEERRQQLFTASYVLVAIGFLSLAFLTIVVGSGAGILFVTCGIVLFQVLWIEASIAGRKRQSQQAELLWLLAATIRNQSSLPVAITNYAMGTFGERRRQLLDFADHIRHGTELSEIAVPQGLLPDSAMMEVQAGVNSGRLYEALRSVAVRHTREMIEKSSSSKFDITLMYPMAILATMSLIVGFMMYYIIPKFKRIFEDFGSELPGMTMVLIWGSNNFLNSWYLTGPLIYLMIIIMVVLQRIEYYGWRTMSQRLLGGLSARVFAPDLLRSLSLSIIADQNLDQALEGILTSGAASSLKRRLWMVRSTLQEGSLIWTELSRRGFLNANEVALLESAQDVGNLPWTMNAIASVIERRWSYQLRAMMDLLGPIAILLVGCFVAFVGIALFLPLINLLYDLA